ncbi:MAG: Dickkopf N-terminal cysteine-rich domain-containing protein [Myxococcaceae bacterium]
MSGREGRCVAVPDGENHGGDCGSGQCAGSCDGQGACRFPGGETVCGDSLCVGSAVQTPACDGQGNCGSKAQPCAPYGCENARCKTSCADPADCSGAAACKADGGCEDKLPAGSACGSGTACASNFCADGVCCDRPCGGSCEACNLPGSEGTCTAIPNGQDPDNECVGTPPCGASCDGSGHCAFGANGTTCGNSVCTSADAPLILRECNGGGQCVDVLQSCGAYACSGGACLSQCSTSSDCRSSAVCESASCLPKLPLGDPCTSPTECQSNFCIEGVCCSSACSGACDTCAGSTPGLCSPRGVGATPETACTNPAQACGTGATCPTTCSATAPCLAGYYCAAGVCTQKKTVGSACGSPSECGSGFCDDSVCCAESCGPQSSCAACNLPGLVGSCSPLQWGFDGQPVCAGNYACRADGTCASGACSDDRDCKSASAFCAGAAGCQLKKANGGACQRARECASGQCVDGVCCNLPCAGACAACNLPGTVGSCTNVPPSQDVDAECVGGLACNGNGGCFTAPCSANNQCEAGYVCQGGACVAGKPRGASCSGPNECGPALTCDDGTCCNSLCGVCKSCDLGGQAGTCVNTPANTDPRSECAGGLTCNGLGACRTSCANSSECESGYACISGACQQLKGYGQSCTAASDCASGFCANGFCCDGACSGGCQACNFPGKQGSCLPFPPGSNPGSVCGPNACNGAGGCGSSCSVDAQCSTTAFCNTNTCATKFTDGTACAADNQCANGHCVDGVCCDTACNGECQSCNSPGLPKGTCTAFALETDPDNECAGGLGCNGNSQCFTSCGANTACESSFHCDLAQSSCVPDSAPGVACNAPDDCVSNNCNDSVCCSSACGTSCEACNVPGQVGTCVPHAALSDPESGCGKTFCDGSGACIAQCANDTQCKAGNFCNASRQCVSKNVDGTPCSAANECNSNLCIDGVCCGGACSATCMACNVPTHEGVCFARPRDTDATPPQCGNTFCSGTGSTCLASCAGDVDCKAGFFCNAGTCTAKKSAGQSCAGQPTACQSGLTCVDNVCCTTACGAACSVCASGTGTCGTAAASTPPKGGACPTYVCNGTSGSCPGSCTADTDCAASAFCNTPASPASCVPDKGSGASCTRDAECQSGLTCRGPTGSKTCQ